MGPFHISIISGKRFLLTIISIDGPASSGKSTTAKLVAQKLGFKYIDTGAMYRASTLAVLASGVNPHNEIAVVRAVSNSSIKLVPGKGKLKILLNNRNVSKEIRSKQVTEFVSLISTYRGVREHLVALQREMAESDNVVCEGRDIGTVVFPNADLKLYIDCSIDERAKRRLLDLRRAGIKVSIDEVKEQLEKRDKTDSERELSPLTVPQGSEIIDTTSLTIEEEIKRVLELFYAHKEE